MNNLSKKLATYAYEPIIGSLLAELRAKIVQRLAALYFCKAQEGKCAHKEKRLHRPRILDCCSGAGGLLQQIETHFGGQGTFVGLDLDAYMLQRAHMRVPHAHMFRANACFLPFKDACFDVVIVCMALHTMPYAMALHALQELGRVGHRVLVADYCLGERNICMPAVALGHAVEWLVGGSHYRCYKEFMRQGALEGFVDKTHLTPVQRHTALGGAALLMELKSVNRHHVK